MDATRGQGLEKAATHSAVPQFPRGMVGRILTGLWFVLLALAVIMPLAGLFSLAGRDRNVWQPIERIGLLVSQDGSDVGLIPMSSEAVRSGIRLGDRPVAIDGKPIRAADFLVPAVTARLVGADGTTVLLTTLSRDGVRKDHRLTRTWRHADTFYAPAGISRSTAAFIALGLAYLPSLFLTLAAVLVFRQRFRQPVAGVLSAAFLIAASGGYAGSQIYGEIGLPGLSSAHETLSWGTMALALLLFPNGRFVNRWARRTAMLILPFALLDLFAPLPWQAHQVMGISFVLASVLFLLWGYGRLPAGVERQQVRWALFGFALGTGTGAIGVVGNLVLAGDVSSTLRLAGMIASNASLGLPALFVTAGLLVSLFGYRLYDAEAIVSRSVAYAALTVILVGLFAATEKILELAGEAMFDDSLGVLAGVLGAAVATAMIVPLHRALTGWAERRFQKQLIRLRRDLPALVGDLRDIAPPARIAAATLDSVIAGVRSSRAALLVDDDVAAARAVAAEEVECWRHNWLPAATPGLDTDRSDALFPVRVPLEADGHGRVGWLLLGPRPDGSLYGKDERDALAAIADPVARALEIARMRETREAAARDRWLQQDGLNAQLARTLAGIDAKLDQLIARPPAPAPKRKPSRTSRTARPA